MKEFCIRVDVTMTGEVYVDAKNKEEAIAKFMKMHFTANDLRNFSQTYADIIDIEEE